jgi:hypothetical protein
MKSKTLILFLILISTFSFGQNTNISEGQVFDGEPYLSIDPDNSQHLVIAWMSWGFVDKISIKIRTSFDGGNTWTNSKKIAHVKNEYTSADPCLAFDHQGNVFLSFIDFSGYDVSPFEGGIYTCKSSDGGMNWQEAVEVINIDSDSGKRPIDRPWMSIDRTTGDKQGNIYITSMNAKEASPGYNPYFVKSTDGGQSYQSWRYLDSINWLSGSFIKQPMPTNCITSDGAFHAVYPSYVFTQNTKPQFIIASSSDAGNSFNYQSILSSNNSITDSLIKKAYLLRASPVNSQHLAFFYFDINNNDISLFMIESFDQGINWTSPQQINDDITENRMQDLVWADFDVDGDLVVSWRDRRNGTSSSYTTNSEIWASVRHKDSTKFSANFRISDTLVPYDDILAYSGNDFMCIKMMDDTLFAIWGDTRNGKLNIWFQKMDVKGNISSSFQITQEDIPSIHISPNPFCNILHIKGKNITQISIFNESGKLILDYQYLKRIQERSLDLSHLIKGFYIIQIKTDDGLLSRKILK